jgi:arginyl-tRNA synthetase
VLGEAISSLLESTGWDVSREYYFNDTGRQMLLLGESLAVRYSDEGDDPPIPEGGYRGEYLCQWAADLRKVSGPDLTWKENSDTFISFAMDRAMDSIRSDLDLLGIRFDRFFSESELIPDAVQKTIDRLARTEVNGQSLIFSDPDGSGKIWLRFTALGRPEDRVIVRGNGMYTYRMPDIAYHIDKFERGYQMMIDVFGADHHDTAQDVGAALEALLGKRCVSSRLKVIIHQFVTLIRGGVKVKMSTRAGEFVTIKDLVSEAGSVDVTKYLFLTRRAEAHMDFDLDIAKMESNENPVYYVQYAHARIAGVMRTATEAGITLPDFDSTEIPSLLKGKHQRELMRLLEMVPSRVGAAAESLEPHRLTEILAMLATGFHRFYQHVRIVDPENPMVSSARLMLCEACRKSISGLLEILGVSAPERM